MRIAIIGSHCTGKSTLVQDFLGIAPGYGFEPEPYETLTESGVVFPDEPGFDDFVEQIAASIAALDRRSKDPDVVFERAPLDLAAYLDVLGEPLGEEMPDELRDEAADAMRTLDLVVLLPVGRPDRLAAVNPERPRLRLKVDRRLQVLVHDDPWEIFGAGGPRLVEIDGSPARRVELLRRAAGL